MEAKLIRISTVLALAIAVVSIGLFPTGTAQAASCPPTFAGGTGSPGNPFLVATDAQLENINCPGYLGYEYRLSASISLTGTWTPIGSSAAPFTGRFDGAGFTISGLTVTGASTPSGLFGVIKGASAGDTARVTDLQITGGSVTGTAQQGLLAGIADFATITDVSVAGAVSGTTQVGGLVGQLGDNLRAANITGSHSSVTVSATGTASGGLVGLLYSGSSVTSSSASGSVTTSNLNAGGLVGIANGAIALSTASTTVNSTVNTGSANAGGLVGSSSSSINSSSATGTVNANAVNPAENIGGLAGLSTGTVSQSFASGSVSATTGHSNVGGLVGQFDSSGLIERSFATGVVNGGNNSGGLVGLVTQSSLADVYASGAVTGTNRVGGLIGHDASPSTGTVTRAYSIGFVSGSNNLGGLVGAGDSADVTFSYWDTATSNQMLSPGGGIARTTSELQSVANFPTWVITTTVSNSFTWGVCGNLNGGLPFLQWYAADQSWSCAESPNIPDPPQPSIQPTPVPLSIPTPMPTPPPIVTTPNEGPLISPQVYAISTTQDAVRIAVRPRSTVPVTFQQLTRSGRWVPVEDATVNRRFAADADVRVRIRSTAHALNSAAVRVRTERISVGSPIPLTVTFAGVRSTITSPHAESIRIRIPKTSGGTRWVFPTSNRITLPELSSVKNVALVVKAIRGNQSTKLHVTINH